MKGFFNRIMRIDLSNRAVRYEELPDAVLEETLGGKGLGTHLLLKENPPGVDPFAPEAIFALTTGPLTGTRAWASARFGAYAKSPATGGYGESYCGGDTDARIKGCGVDAVVLTGASDKLVWLRVDEQGVSFMDAEPLRGRGSFETEEHVLKESAEKAGSLAIGPAGENRVASACIKSEKWRSLGRGGMGAVLGSKNIKAITFAGKLKAPLADDAGLLEFNKAIALLAKDSPGTLTYRKRGTPNQVGVTNQQKCFPTRYWQSGTFDRWQELSADYMIANFEIKNHPCPNCFLQCTKHSKLKSGRHAGLEIDGPEYETIYAIGGLNCIAPLEEVVWLNHICDDLGIDTMSAGNLSAFAVEAYKRGKSDFEIDYGQPDRVAELYGMIARREGVGAVLAKGIKSAAEEWSLEDIAVHSKGLEPAGFDPRVLKGMGLSYATAARGACHLRGTFYKAELSGEIAGAAIQGKAALHIDYEDRSCLFDCLILCRFFRDLIKWDELRTLFRVSTGVDMDKPALERFANRVTLASREYNRREGLGPESDKLPSAMFKPNAEGATLDPAEMQALIGDYNAIRASRCS
jgi:aldehyde:ferredoxin oxidoreductase